MGELNPGSVHRTLTSSTFFSGKGGNVAVAMERLGNVDIELIQALGGEPGKLIEKDMERFSIKPRSLWVSQSTRVCTTLTEKGGRTTELIEPSPELSLNEWERIAEMVEDRLKENRDVLICGSFPGGNPSSLIEALSRRPKESNLWVDGLRQDILELAPMVLKINHKELATLVEKTRSIAVDCEEVSARFGIPNLVITSEDGPVTLWEKSGVQEIPVPSLPGVVNTTGAGDTFFGALAHGRLSGKSWKQSVELGIEWAGLRCGLPNVEDLPSQKR
jgi:fructose-1-phosphate kinase PfkB-like protein